MEIRHALRGILDRFQPPSLTCPLAPILALRPDGGATGTSGLPCDPQGSLTMLTVLSKEGRPWAVLIAAQGRLRTEASLGVNGKRCYFQLPNTGLEIQP